MATPRPIEAGLSDPRHRLSSFEASLALGQGGRLALAKAQRSIRRKGRSAETAHEQRLVQSGIALDEVELILDLTDPEAE